MKKKFALCFRPMVIETDEPHHPGRAVAIATVKNNNGRMPPSSTRTSFMEKSYGGQTSFHPTTNHSRKSISKVLKTILDEPSLGIRVDGGKINGGGDFHEKTNDLIESNGHIGKVEDHKRKRQANTTSEENKIVPTISSSSSSSSTTSSSPSSCNVSSLSNQSSKDFKSLSMKRYLARTNSNTSFDKKKKAKIRKTNVKALDSSSALSPMQDKDFVFYWIVLTLLAIILWGKAFAIVLASMWLYFIPYRGGNHHLRPENNSGELPEVETCTDDHCSWEYKKKVIMEGLLERQSTAPTESIKSLT